MEIIVEIGDETTRPLIHDEIDFFVSTLSNLPEPLDLYQIIVPQDFAGKVNELEGRTDFTGKHGIEDSSVGVMAKNVICGDKRIILLSPMLYFEMFDSMIRCNILFHEIGHVINARRIPDTTIHPFALSNYLANLYYLYDEYFSDRLSYSITDVIFKEPSEPWIKFTTNEVEGYLSSANDERYYYQIRDEIESFRNHGDVDRFMNQIFEPKSVVAITTVHAFARYHHIKDTMQDFVVPKSNFVNQSAIALMEYYYNKYETGDFDFSDGVELITEYYKYFGFRLEDRGKGGYVYVLDI